MAVVHGVTTALRYIPLINADNVQLEGAVRWLTPEIPQPVGQIYWPGSGPIFPAASQGDVVTFPFTYPLMPEYVGWLSEVHCCTVLQTATGVPSMWRQGTLMEDQDDGSSVHVLEARAQGGDHPTLAMSAPFVNSDDEARWGYQWTPQIPIADQVLFRLLDRRRQGTITFYLESDIRANILRLVVDLVWLVWPAQMRKVGALRIPQLYHG